MVSKKVHSEKRSKAYSTCKPQPSQSLSLPLKVSPSPSISDEPIFSSFLSLCMTNPLPTKPILFSVSAEIKISNLLRKKVVKNRLSLVSNGLEK